MNETLQAAEDYFLNGYYEMAFPIIDSMKDRNARAKYIYSLFFEYGIYRCTVNPVKAAFYRNEAEREGELLARIHNGNGTDEDDKNGRYQWNNGDWLALLAPFECNMKFGNSEEKASILDGFYTIIMDEDVPAYLYMVYSENLAKYGEGDVLEALGLAAQKDKNSALVYIYLAMDRMMEEGHYSEEAASEYFIALNKMASEGYVEAMRMLLTCYDKGFGTPVDMGMANYWYQRLKNDEIC